MIPTDPADREALAGEYVLGTLDARMAREIEQAMPADTALRDAVAAWEARLAPLTALAPPERGGIQAAMHVILRKNGWPIIANGCDTLVIGRARYNAWHEQRLLVPGSGIPVGRHDVRSCRQSSAGA